MGRSPIAAMYVPQKGEVFLQTGHKNDHTQAAMCASRLATTASVGDGCTDVPAIDLDRERTDSNAITSAKIF
jgi:hypothetical protein